MPRSAKFLLCFFTLFVLFLASYTSANAAVDSCTVSVSPSNVSPNSIGDLTFSVTNGAAATILWVKIAKPSDGFSISGGTSSGFSGSVSGSSIIFTSTDGFIGANVTTDFVVNVSATTGSQGTWTVEASDVNDGSGAVSCIGESRVAISSSPADTSAPAFVGDLSITNISDTAATFVYTTDESTTTTINYGTTQSYGSNATDTLNTSHSITIGNLTANTKYFYKISITDAAGNTTNLNESSFVTAKAGLTITETTVVTTTKNITKYLTDTIKPSAGIKTNLNKVYSKAPTINGLAKDDMGVSLVEYSIDDGLNWTVADINSRIGAKSVDFTFAPQIIDDGNYKIRIRTTDSSGNKDVSKTYTLIIDRIPPSVGGVLYSLGAIILSPNSDGSILGVGGLNIGITLSAIGGPVNINVVAGSKTFPLTKSSDSNLWKGLINLDKGSYRLNVTSVDGAGNTTQKDLNLVNILSPGQVLDGEKAVDGASVSVYYFDNLSDRFILWEGSNYGQSNPETTDANGGYKFLLPAGKYYLEVKKEGYKTLNSEIFTINQDTPINQSFSLKHTKSIRLGSLLLTIPYFPQLEKINVIPTNSLKPPVVLTGKNIPDFSFSEGKKSIDSLSLRGKPTALIFLNSWLPQTPEILATLSSLSLDKRFNIICVLEQETDSFASIFKKRGAYEVRIVADTDGSLINPLKIVSLPETIFVDKSGVIKSSKLGILTADEIVDNLIN